VISIPSWVVMASASRRFTRANVTTYMAKPMTMNRPSASSGRVRARCG
jgi:hypothetical protein